MSLSESGLRPRAFAAARFSLHAANITLSSDTQRSVVLLGVCSGILHGLHCKNQPACCFRVVNPPTLLVRHTLEALEHSNACRVSAQHTVTFVMSHLRRRS